ncbi:MAG: C2H2-type zinc finger protein [Promethearchaeota archaeon]
MGRATRDSRAPGNRPPAGGGRRWNPRKRKKGGVELTPPKVNPKDQRRIREEKEECRKAMSLPRGKGPSRREYAGWKKKRRVDLSFLAALDPLRPIQMDEFLARVKKRLPPDTKDYKMNKILENLEKAGYIRWCSPDKASLEWGSQRPFKCPLCTRKFSDPEKLVNHEFEYHFTNYEVARRRTKTENGRRVKSYRGPLPNP